MRLIIEDHCIRCGICIDICTDLFEMDEVEDAIHIKVEEIPETLITAANDAVAGCSVGAIHLE
jgi:ferredoxin